MKIYLVRHGETFEGNQGIILGNMPGTLADSGKIYAKNVGSYISTLVPKPQQIVSSDLRRAVATAEIISKITDIQLSFEPLLRERSAGVVEGKMEIEIDWDSYEKQPLAYRKHLGGESFKEVNKRVKKFLDNILKQSNTDLILVTHSVVISMFLSELLEWDYKKSLGYKYKNSILILDISEDGTNITELSI